MIFTERIDSFTGNLTARLSQDKIESFGTIKLEYKPHDAKSGMEYKSQALIPQQCLFQVGEKLKNSLNHCVIPECLLKEFEKHNIFLSQKTAVIIVVAKDEEWEIIDQEKEYFIRKEAQNLNIYAKNPNENFEFVKFYRFKKLEHFSDPSSSFLKCPDGANLFSIVMRKKETRIALLELFENCGLKVVFERRDRTFKIQKEMGKEIFNFPYQLVSDTLQNILFHMIAIESNHNAVITFEEPEAKAFPFYTKQLAERIAFDESNQYFITTHNPYFLQSVIEKTPKVSINVFVTYMKDYATHVKCLNPDELSELISYDPFLNLDMFLEEK